MADKIAREPKYRSALVDTMAVQVKIKQVIVRDLSDGVSESKTKAKVKKLIDAFCERISDESFRARARAALIRSFAKWYREAATVYSTLPFLVLSFYRNPPTKAVQAARKRAARLPAPTANRVADLTPHVEYGREWHDADYRKRLKAAYTRYLARFADDEAKHSRRVSLRNLAEVEVRRGEIADMLAGLRARGVRLAWASSHADCSERCSHWQGKLYSLDGTYGTENGTPYQPIENAVNVIDKYGNVNGLFGYNCRHRLVPYTPKSRPPRDYSAAVMAKERAVDGRQRQMERIIRNWKTRGHVLKSENPDASRKAFEKAREWTDRYEKYSHANGRACYRERITVMTEEMRG